MACCSQNLLNIGTGKAQHREIPQGNKIHRTNTSPLYRLYDFYLHLASIQIHLPNTCTSFDYCAHFYCYSYIHDICILYSPYLSSNFAHFSSLCLHLHVAILSLHTIIIIIVKSSLCHRNLPALY